ncbi:hypothetical protein BU16DRAFT_543381 [Lophium mytilinum]|uniref:Uncharacterized protein n=1 Tax=Lophium mytilinum TaxID=390894 RepID=A0A6A6QI37_9PEZI|nr:hypothetical protein BU16DRAFT_543381 [Lophium mytilinum]
MLFGWNNRGFSFDVEADCNKSNASIDCSVSFRNGSNIVSAFGHRDQITPDPDIAGKGAPTENGTTSCSSRSRTSWAYQAIVYIANFISTGKCNLTTYHYYVALDSVLVACSTLVLIFISARHHYRTTVASLVRFSATVVIFSLLGIFIVYLAHKNRQEQFPELFPPRSRNDSAILLPVSCFIDKDLIHLKTPFATDVNPPLLTTEQQARMGRPIKTGYLPEIILYLFLMAYLFLGMCAQLWDVFCKDSRRAHVAKRTSFVLKAFWSTTFLLCLGTDIYCIAHIGWLKGWAASSGWMKDGREGDLSTIGQIMAIATPGLFLVACCDKVKFRKGPEKNMDHEERLPLTQQGYSSVPQPRR